MSIVWQTITGRREPWYQACIEHDRAYWRGGTRLQRKKADRRLRAEVAAIGYPVWAWLMYLAVRIGGSPYLPFTWRWGYGWKYPHR